VTQPVWPIQRSTSWKAVDYLRVDNASSMSISMSMNNGSVDIGITPLHLS
jgi:hypothetical protein